MAIKDYIPIIGTVNKVIDLGSEAILDKDKKAEFDAAAIELKEKAYLAELGTKTIPVIDGIHKLIRPVSSLVAQILGFIIALQAVQAGDPVTACVAIGAGQTPQTIYNAVKGKG